MAIKWSFGKMIEMLGMADETKDRDARGPPFRKLSYERAEVIRQWLIVTPLL